MAGMRVTRAASGKDFDELFSLVILAWLKDTREVMSREKAKRFREVFDKGVSEKSFVLRGMRLGPNTAVAIGQGLLRASLLKLDLYDNLLRNNGAEAVAMLLKECTSITHLNLGANDIGPMGILHVSLAIQSHKRLQTLILGSAETHTHVNKVDSASGKMLAEALKRNKSLKHLDLGRTPLGTHAEQDAFAGLSAVFEKLGQLQVIRLGSTGMGSESCVGIVKKLLGANVAQEIDFSGNDLNAGVAENLARGLQSIVERKQKVTLKRVNLGGNPKLGERGTSPLFNVLCYPECAITLLNLCNTGVTDDAVLCLANALKYTTTLNTISLSNNFITELGCIALSQQLEAHVSVQSLNLSENKIKCEGAVALAAMLETNRVLVALDIEDCRIGDQGCVALGVAVANNASLERLKLSKNHISDAAGHALCSLLEKNRTVQILHVKGNQIDHSTQSRLAKLLKRNKDLKMNEVPNQLHKEIIRLHYQQCKLQEANTELQFHQRSRLKLQEEMDSHESRLAIERETAEKKSQELLEKVRREEQELLDIEQKKDTKEKEFHKFQEDLKADIERLGERLKEETSRREEQERCLADKKQELEDLIRDQDNSKEAIAKQIESVRVDTQRYTEQAEDMEAKLKALEDTVSQLESTDKERRNKELDKKSATDAAKQARREKATKKKEEEDAAAKLLFDA
ncbi:RAN GTPase-activating protein 1 [Diplonema papillatum]|nr:RAN GTPase-activating protein 1 [Diplonema papillatum]